MSGKKYAVIIVHGDSRRVAGLIRRIENMVENKKLDYYVAFRGPIDEIDDVKNEVANAVMNVWNKKEQQ